MTTSPSDDLVVLAEAVRKRHLGRETDRDATYLAQAECRPLAGGRNNGVWRVRVGDDIACVKCFRLDERQRGRREWAALMVLARLCPGLAPRPLFFVPQTGPDAPAVLVMGFLPGRSLGEVHLSPAERDALGTALHKLHATVTPDAVHALAQLRNASAGGDGDRALGPVWAGAAEVQQRVRAFFTDVNQPILSTTCTREADWARRLWRAWCDGPDPTTLAQPVPGPPTFGRGDSNLANVLWDPDASVVRFVDWEYSGWSERAFDLADLVEHVQSRQTPDADWSTFVAGFGLTNAEQARFEAARRLVALFWITLLWPVPNAHSAGHSARFTAQVERAGRLLEPKSA